MHALAAADDPNNAAFPPSPSPTSGLTLPSVLPDCIPNTYTANDMNALLASRGPNFVLSLCPSTRYSLETTIMMTAAGQEISTMGYPDGSERAMLVVEGSTDLKEGMTTAIHAVGLQGVKVRNIQSW